MRARPPAVLLLAVAALSAIAGGAEAKDAPRDPSAPGLVALFDTICLRHLGRLDEAQAAAKKTAFVVAPGESGRIAMKRAARDGLGPVEVELRTANGDCLLNAPVASTTGFPALVDETVKRTLPGSRLELSLPVGAAWTGPGGEVGVSSVNEQGQTRIMLMARPKRR